MASEISPPIIPNVVVFVSILGQDENYVPNFLAEMDRVGLGFVVRFDKCSCSLIRSVESHRGFMQGVYDERPHFDERYKQEILDLSLSLSGPGGYALNLDVDETLERDARRKICEFLPMDFSNRTKFDCYTVDYVNLYGSPEFYRSEEQIGKAKREKLFAHSSQMEWVYRFPHVNGPRLIDNRRCLANFRLGHLPITVLHWGMMTHSSRVLHKARWDRIYGASVGKNPYGYWDSSLIIPNNEDVLENQWLPEGWKAIYVVEGLGV